MSFTQQLFSGNSPLSRRRALLGLSLLALSACSRSGKETPDTASGVAYYTCTMHPFVRSQDPKGKCPVCGMDLVPVSSASGPAVSANAVSKDVATITPERMQEIGVTTEAVTRRNLMRSFRVPAQVVANASGARDDGDLWIVAQFTEDQRSLLSLGRKVGVTVSSQSLQKMEGEIRFIDPHPDDKLHLVPVRIVVPGQGHGYYPGQFAFVSGEASVGERLTISSTAVMPTGNKYIVFVDRGGGRLEPREIEVGIQTDDSYEVLSGLKEGDRVVSSANFLIDAESRIQGALKTWGDRP
jgi:hypothetical protein